MCIYINSWYGVKTWHLPSVHINEHHMVYFGHLFPDGSMLSRILLILAWCEKTPSFEWLKKKYCKKCKTSNIFLRQDNNDDINKQTKNTWIWNNREDGEKNNKGKFAFILIVEKGQDLKNETIGVYVIYVEIFSTKTSKKGFIIYF